MKQAPPLGVDAAGAAPATGEAAAAAKSDLEVARAAGFRGEKEAEKAFREAGVNRVVEGLRAENTRLRQRLRAAEHAAQAAEDRADGESDKSVGAVHGVFFLSCFCTCGGSAAIAVWWQLLPCLNCLDSPRERMALRTVDCPIYAGN